MKRIVVSLLAGGLFLGTAAGSFAETRIHQRKENQQNRIAKGVKNGSMAARETAHVEHKESRLNKEVRADRKENGGNLTNNQKRQINRQQSRLSKQIYRDKHNGRTQ
ncbi:MAG TPA: hypothetical protein VFW83_10180 [Bryobacteraceae bacterium]|nr:hypothetical protein [Bryobacteraceae bacterium]